MVTISIELAIDRSSERASEAERNAASDHTQPCTAMAMPWPPRGKDLGSPKLELVLPNFCPDHCFSAHQ
jgi:hypothetical protein